MQEGFLQCILYRPLHAEFLKRIINTYLQIRRVCHNGIDKWTHLLDEYLSGMDN